MRHDMIELVLAEARRASRSRGPRGRGGREETQARGGGGTSRGWRVRVQGGGASAEGQAVTSAGPGSCRSRAGGVRGGDGQEPWWGRLEPGQPRSWGCLAGAASGCLHGAGGARGACAQARSCVHLPGGCVPAVTARGEPLCETGVVRTQLDCCSFSRF